MLSSIQELREQILKSGKQLDLAKIEQAYFFAEKAHGDQKRVSGEPYIVHPLNVASILVGLGMDNETLIAALLHDVVEDTPVTMEEVTRLFGSDVSLLVDGVTKLGKIPFSSREEQQAENIRKMLLAMAQDVRVVIIKLADRLHNMRTIDVMPPQKQRDKALETMEVYAPLAHRLGIRGIKVELEDISLRYLDNVAYEEIEKMLALKKDERADFLNHMKKKILARVQEEHKDAYIEGRVKSIYGIYRKVFMGGRAFEEIYDVYAVRLIVDTVFDCYSILGIIHDMFHPIPNRFKDYISTPKSNMYQSLHTTVVDKEGIPFEVQIRTWDMHYTAEYGIAAHWKYKAGISGGDKMTERLAWVRQLLEAQQESEDAEDLIRSIKTDLSLDEVFAFTPKGDVISLPAGATVIDFAYAIHTAVGNRMIGAKVDGRMVSIDFEIKTGNIVEIITTNSPTHGPSRDWIKIVKTSGARNKIRAWFKKERREENIREGREELEREFRRNSITLTEEQGKEFLLDIAKRQRFTDIEDFLAALGYGGVSLSKIMPRIKEDYLRIYRTSAEDKLDKNIIKPKKDRKASSGVIVEGLDGCLVKFSRCCNPLPGDDIVGFITRGFGVSIHKRDCVNVVNSIHDPEQKGRWVKAEWAGNVKDSLFKSSIVIYGNDRSGLLADVSIAIANMRVPLHALNARETKDKQSVIQVTIGITSLDQLNNIISTFQKISGVISVERSNQ
ncbi:MAG: bifunctional (p)ppGpp synthetase/guanosine-3',5'-bis(diphosphate) 3'-pyrophosphohydrolase [Oscillospiraceae bacterium]|nr:bifunctional (p)ppGpp synthetase/guanosine-3',5'-bis(diphosphate) 3'-pyrophosphohydrolase [Oscillospiraceae bacterium]